MLLRLERLEDETMIYFIAILLCLAVIGGAMVYRKNQTKIDNVIDAVKK